MLTLGALCLEIVPFEEDERDPRTWFLDHNFIEEMQTMFKKVSGTLYHHQDYKYMRIFG